MSSVNIHFVGIGGRTVSKILAYALQYVRALQPDIIILEIGSNDLCEVRIHPETVGSNVESLVSILHKVCQAAFIVACQTIHRATLPSQCPEYNSFLDILNTYLEVVLKPLSFAEFWHHKGLCQPNVPILKRDGVHLNKGKLRPLPQLSWSHFVCDAAHLILF